MVQRENHCRINFLNPRINPRRTSRRGFLKKAAPVAIAGLAAANSGCIVLPLVGEALGAKPSKGLDSVVGLLPPTPKLPNMRQDIDLLLDYFEQLDLYTQQNVRSVLFEWYPLTSFVNSSRNPFMPSSTDLDSIKKMVFPIVRSDGAYGSGVLITPNHVLSAAHVVNDLPLNQSFLQVAQDRNGGYVDIPFTHAIIRNDLDLAVLRLSPEYTITEFGNEPLKPLATLSARLPASFSSVYLFGYPPGGFESRALLMLRSKVAQNSASSDSFSFLSFGEENVISGTRAGYSPGQRVALVGSSGGPVVDSSGTILGIQSRGPEDEPYSIAMGPERIRITVIDYLIDHIAPKIRELANQIRSRLGQ